MSVHVAYEANCPCGNCSVYVIALPTAPITITFKTKDAKGEWRKEATFETAKAIRSNGVSAGTYAQAQGSKEMIGPSDRRKHGRPRIGEQPDKPWLKCKPPISERTWYRRQKEKK